jgi:hypothetical protein
MEKNSIGIIVGVDAKQEYLLPIFFLNLRLHSDLPITFFDFGMSPYGQDFCNKRGCVITIDDSLVENLGSQNTFFLKQNVLNKDADSPSCNLIQDSENHNFENYGHLRYMWFKKPVAILTAPYERNLWLDLDCKVTGPLEEIFDSLDAEQDLCLILDAAYLKNTSSYLYPMYNSGVIAFRQQSLFIDEWIKASKSGLYWGDQDALSAVLAKYQKSFITLDERCNMFFHSENLNTKKLPVILHYVFVLKELLFNELQLLQNFRFDQKGAFT